MTDTTPNPTDSRPTGRAKRRSAHTRRMLIDGGITVAAIIGVTSRPDHPTSLHSAAKDEPLGGNEGGLIGVHVNSTTTGAVSHGCVRLTAAAIAAVNQLSLGAPITIRK